jgi:hypothetical protein
MLTRPKTQESAMTKRWLIAAAAVLVIAGAGIAKSQTKIDLTVVRQIRAEGMERSHVADLFHTLTVRIGPRLTGSPAQKEASRWAREQLAGWGYGNAHLEPWTFGRGWTLDKLTAEMTAPRYTPLIAYAEGWSPSTSGEIVGTPIYLGDKTAAEVAAMGASLKGAIVLTQPIQTTFVTEDRPDPTTSDDPRAGTAPRFPNDPARTGDAGRAFLRALHQAGVGVAVKPSPGIDGTVFVLGRDQGADAVPSMVMAAEHYNLIVRMLRQKIPVKLRLDVQGHYTTDDPDTYNVIAELPGVDPALKDEVVMIGGHIDSWHGATGSADNADGTAEILEAARILKTIGARPRRTIRFAIWSGEEQGLLGSRAWVAQHLAGDANRTAREKFDVYLNVDSGTDKIFGFYLEHDAAAKPLFDAWLAPLRDLGARKNVLLHQGATDHMSFLPVGVPAFNSIQDYTDYDVRKHHTNMDTDERVHDADLKEAAIAMATFAYEAAMADERVPAVPKGTQE